MTTIRARDLLKQPREHVWDLSTRSDITHIEMDDGIHPTYSGEIILSRYAWIMHEQFPETPLTKNMLHQDRYFNTDAFNVILNEAYWACYYANGKPDIKWRERRWLTMYRVINHLYNDIAIHCAEYVRGATAVDYLEIMDLPEIAEIRNFLQTKPRILPQDFIDNYAKAKKIILNSPALDNNPLAIAVRCGSIKMDQLIQIVIARGYCADADSRLFRDAVRVAYMDGLRTLEAVLMDSRGAARAIYYQKKPTKDSEYLNRRLQLVSQIVKRLYEKGCGSTDYREVLIDSESTLRDYAGKLHYIDGNAVELRRQHTQYVGKVLQIKSVFCCVHTDRYGVCMDCFGPGIGLSIPDLTNLGHECVSTVLGRFVQLLLSAKHIILSAVGGARAVGYGEEAQYIRINTDDAADNNIYMTDINTTRPQLLTLGPKEARMISDLHEVENIEELSVTRMTAIRTFLLSSKDDLDVGPPVLIDLRNYEVACSLSMDMLKYIMKYGYGVDDVGHFVIDLTHWDWTKPFLFVPVTQFSIPMFIAGVETYIVSASKTKGITKKEVAEDIQVQEYLKGKRSTRSSMLPRITDYDNAIDAVNELYRIISQKMDVNIAHLEIIVLSLTANDPDDGDFRPPLNRRDAKIISYNQAMQFRSMSQLFAYEDQTVGLYALRANLIKHRADHPYDELFPFYEGVAE